MAVQMNSGEKMQALIRYNGAYYAVEATHFVVEADEYGSVKVRLEGKVNLTVTWPGEHDSEQQSPQLPPAQKKLR